MRLLSQGENPPWIPILLSQCSKATCPLFWDSSYWKNNGIHSGTPEQR